MRKIALALIAILLLPTIALAATPSEDFESYSLATLNGDNGGSGWSGAWTDVVTGFSVENTVVLGGTKSATGNGSTGSDNQIKRAMTAFSGTTQEIQFKIRKDVVANDPCMIQLYTGSTFKGQMEMRTDGTIFLAAAAGTVSILASYAANTTYTITIDVDTTNNRWRGKVDAGSYSSYAGLDAAGAVDTFYLGIQNAVAGSSNCYWDDIQAPAAASNPFYATSYWWFLFQ